MTTFTYAELEGLWIQAGGSRVTAPIAAAIAEAESGGRSSVTSGNPDGGTNVGLWQLDTPGGKGAGFSVAQLQDPATNARVAVRGSNDGRDWSAWQTFVDGAYKRFLSGKTTPNMNVPSGGAGGGGAGGGGGITLDAAVQTLNPDCLWSVGWAGISGTANVGKGANWIQAALGALTGQGSGVVGGSIAGAQNAGNIGAFKACIISKSEARALVGAGLMLLGLPIAMAGLVVLGVAAGLKALGPVGGVAEGVGGAITFIPGAQGAGAAVSSAGRAARSGRRRASGQASEPDPEVVLGEPKENPDLEVRGGTVRESDSQRAARKRRESAAARARARRSAGQGRPASREETGF